MPVTFSDDFVSSSEKAGLIPKSSQPYDLEKRTSALESKIKAPAATFDSSFLEESAKMMEKNPAPVPSAQPSRYSPDFNNSQIRAVPQDAPISLSRLWHEDIYGDQIPAPGTHTPIEQMQLIHPLADWKQKKREEGYLDAVNVQHEAKKIADAREADRILNSGRQLGEKERKMFEGIRDTVDQSWIENRSLNSGMANFSKRFVRAMDVLDLIPKDGYFNKANIEAAVQQLESPGMHTPLGDVNVADVADFGGAIAAFEIGGALKINPLPGGKIANNAKTAAVAKLGLRATKPAQMAQEIGLETGRGAIAGAIDMPAITIIGNAIHGDGTNLQETWSSIKGGAAMGAAFGAVKGTSNAIEVEVVDRSFKYLGKRYKDFNDFKSFADKKTFSDNIDKTVKEGKITAEQAAKIKADKDLNFTKEEQTDSQAINRIENFANKHAEELKARQQAQNSGQQSPINNLPVQGTARPEEGPTEFPPPPPYEGPQSQNSAVSAPSDIVPSSNAQPTTPSISFKMDDGQEVQIQTELGPDGQWYGKVPGYEQLPPFMLGPQYQDDLNQQMGIEILPQPEVLHTESAPTKKTWVGNQKLDDAQMEHVAGAHPLLDHILSSYGQLRPIKGHEREFMDNVPEFLWGKRVGKRFVSGQRLDEVVKYISDDEQNNFGLDGADTNDLIEKLSAYKQHDPKTGRDKTLAQLVDEEMNTGAEDQAAQDEHDAKYDTISARDRRLRKGMDLTIDGQPVKVSGLTKTHTLLDYGDGNIVEVPKDKTISIDKGSFAKSAGSEEPSFDPEEFAQDETPQIASRISAIETKIMKIAKPGELLAIQHEASNRGWSDEEYLAALEKWEQSGTSTQSIKSIQSNQSTSPESKPVENKPTVEIEIDRNNKAQIFVVQNPDGTFQARQKVATRVQGVKGSGEKFAWTYNLAFQKESYPTAEEAIADSAKSLRSFFLSNNVKTEKLNDLIRKKPAKTKLTDGKEESANQFIDKAIEDLQFTGSMDLNPLSQDEVDRISTIKKIDVTGYKHELIASELRHFLKSHGGADEGKGKTQLPITKDDLKMIPEIIANYDDILDGGVKKKKESIIYKKRVNGTIYYVSVIGTQKGRLTPKTMWKESSYGASVPQNLGKTAKPATNLTSSANTLPSTPENSSPKTKKNEPDRISALYISGSDTVVFYRNGVDIGMMDWESKGLAVVTGTDITPELRKDLESIKAAYLAKHKKPEDDKNIDMSASTNNQPPAAAASNPEVKPEMNYLGSLLNNKKFKEHDTRIKSLPTGFLIDIANGKENGSQGPVIRETIADRYNALPHEFKYQHRFSEWEKGVLAKESWATDILPEDKETLYKRPAVLGLTPDHMAIKNPKMYSEEYLSTPLTNLPSADTVKAREGDRYVRENHQAEFNFASTSGETGSISGTPGTADNQGQQDNAGTRQVQGSDDIPLSRRTSRSRLNVILNKYGKINIATHKIKTLRDAAEFMYELRSPYREKFMMLPILANDTVAPSGPVIIHLGETGASAIDPTLILQAFKASGAAKFVLVHNHPSGNPDCSSDDIRLTTHLKELFTATGIADKFIDHIILDGDKFFSIKEMARHDYADRKGKKKSPVSAFQGDLGTEGGNPDTGINPLTGSAHATLALDQPEAVADAIRKIAYDGVINDKLIILNLNSKNQILGCHILTENSKETFFNVFSTPQTNKIIAGMISEDTTIDATDIKIIELMKETAKLGLNKTEPLLDYVKVNPTAGYRAYKSARESNPAVLTREAKTEYGSAISYAAWPEDFPRTVVMTSGSKLTSHPDHEAAKAGDMDAAARLVEQLAKPDKISALVEKYPDAIVVPVHAQERTGMNQIPSKFADYIGNISGLEVDDTIVQANTVGHTGATAIERLGSRAQFSGSVISGKKYIIVDDFSTQGGTFSELRAFIESNGGEVVQAVSMAASSDAQTGYSGDLAIKKETLLALSEKFGYDKLSEFLKEMEICNGKPEALTNSEGKLLLLYSRLDTARSRIIAAKQKRQQETQPGVLEESKTPSKEINPSVREDNATYAPNTSSSKMLMQLPELVRLAREMMGQDNVRIRERLLSRKGTALGLFHGGGLNLGIDLRGDIFAGHNIGSIEIPKDADFNQVKQDFADNLIAEGKAKESELIFRRNGKLLVAYRRDHSLAPKVLAHEIGHGGDWMDDKDDLKRGNILGHIAAFRNYIKTMIPSEPGTVELISTKERSRLRREAISEARNPDKTIDTARARKIYAKKIADLAATRGLVGRNEVLSELKDLSQWWKPFNVEADPSYTKYRHSPEELYADAISVLLNAPAELAVRAPKFWMLFGNYMIKRPDFLKMYKTIQDDIFNSSTMPERVKSLHAGFERAEQKYAENAKKTFAEKINLSNLGMIANEMFGSKQAYLKSMIAKVRRDGAQIAIEQDPFIAFEVYRYAGAQQELILDKVRRNVIEPLEKQGIPLSLFGEYLFHNRVINERGDFANPGGWRPDTSRERLKEIMAVEGMYYLDVAKQELWNIRKDLVVSQYEKANMASDALMRRMKENDSYATFDVVKFIDGEFGTGTGAKIHQQIGTLADIADPFTATVMKDLQLLRSVYWNNAKRSLVNFLKSNMPGEIQDADTHWVNNHNEFVEPRNQEQGMLMYMDKGKIQAFYVPKRLADSIMSEADQQTAAVMKVANAIGTPFRLIFTQLKLGYPLFNAIRDYERSARNLPGYASPATLIPHYLKAFAPAWKSTGGELVPVVEELLRNNALIAVADHNDLNYLDTQMKRMLSFFDESVQSRFAALPAWKRLPLWMYWSAVRGSKAIERVGKIAAYTYLKDHSGMSDAEIAHRVRTELGSPDFLERGKGTWLLNNIALFSNAAIQGWKTDLQALNRRDVQVKTALFSLPIKLLMWAAASGGLLAIAKQLFGDDDDRTKWLENQHQIMSRVSEYDKANYYIIPLYLTENGQAVYLRMPMDETSKLFGGVAWKSLKTLDGDLDPAKFADILNYSAGQVPTSNPLISVLHGAWDYLRGVNPVNAYNDKPVMKDDTFRARWEPGTRGIAASEFGKWTWQTLGGSYFIPTKAEWQSEIPDESGFAGKIQDATQTPILNDIVARFLKVSDAGIEQDVKKEVLDPIRDEQARDSVLKREIITKLADRDITPSDLPDLEYDVYSRHREEIIKRVRERRKRQNVPVEDRIYMNARSKEERAAVREYLNR